MQLQSDVKLLGQYARQGGEAAFAEIAARHAGLVYSAALRQVESPEAARDIAQSVFIDLARKARALADKFPPEASLVGWLYKSTHFAALKVLRDDQRRQARERQAMAELQMVNPSMQTELDWESVRPLLDQAMSDLDDDDRDALLLRFFKNQDFRAVGAALGVSDDTAQKRVSRALDKLRELLVGRGVTTTAAALSVAISANAVQSAPVGLITAISTAATAAPVPCTAIAATKLITMTTIQKALIGAALTVAIGTGIHEARRASRLNEQVQVLQQQQAPGAEKLQKMQQASDEAARQITALREENEQLRRDTAELLKLRGEVAKLRLASKTSASDANDPTLVAAQSWANRVKTLRQRFEQWPGKKTPELQLLTEQDWLNEAAQHRLDSEEDCRQAMSNLRYEAKKRFASMVNQALKQFTAANNQRLPSDPSDLSSFLEPPANECLSDWEVAKPGWVHPPQPNAPGSESASSWALIEKGSFTPNGIAIRDGSYPSDPQYDQTVVIYNNSWYSYGPVKRAK